MVLLLSSFSQRTKANDSIKAINKTVTFEVVLDTAIHGEPVLYLYDSSFYYLDSQVADKQEIQPVSTKGNTYVFILKDQNKPKYFTLAINNAAEANLLLKQFHFEPGDKLKIAVKSTKLIDRFDFKFSGNWSGKYRCKDELSHIRSLKLGMEVIEKYKPEMSDYSYQLLRADLIGQIGVAQLDHQSNQYLNAIQAGDSLKAKSIAASYISANKLLDVKGIPNEILTASKDYIQYRYYHISVGSWLKNGAGKINLTLDEIKRISDGALRDRVMVLFFIWNWKSIKQDYDEILASAISVTQDKACVNKLKEFGHNAIGQKAFNFSFKDVNGNEVLLSDLRGKAIFLDFWFTGCVFCKHFYKNVLADVEKKYEGNKNIVFASVAIDRNRADWLASVKGGEYTSALALNLYTNGQGGANEFIRYHNIISYPSLMLVDKNGLISKFAGREMRLKEGLITAIDNVLAK